MARPSKYPTDRGIGLAPEDKRPIAHIARDLGIEPELLRRPVLRAEIDAGKREASRPAEVSSYDGHTWTRSSRRPWREVDRTARFERDSGPPRKLESPSTVS